MCYTLRQINGDDDEAFNVYVLNEVRVELLSLERPSRIIFTEFRVMADNVPSGPWVWEVEPLMP